MPGGPAQEAETNDLFPARVRICSVDGKLFIKRQ